METLRALARSRRMYFEVAPEFAQKGSERLVVGYEVRFWAVHASGARALPGCARCGELRSELIRVASWALASSEVGARVEAQPADRRLYQSMAVPGSDEVAFTVRLLHLEAYDRSAAEWGGPALILIRRRLKALGIAER